MPTVSGTAYRGVVRFVGVDLASQPANTSVCIIEWTDRPRVVSIERPATDDLIVDRIGGADAVGLDCPLGWPAPFVETVHRHHTGRSTVGVTGPTGEPVTSRDLRLRTTDQWIRGHLARDPLSVSTDRLGIVALRGIGILERVAGPGADRSGNAHIYEAYPGGSLAVWRLRSVGYKHAGARRTEATDVRAEIVDALRAHIDLGDTGEQMIDNADDLDALLTAVVAGLAVAGHTTSAPAEHSAIAATEGWIHVPTIALAELATVRFDP